MYINFESGRRTRSNERAHKGCKRMEAGKKLQKRPMRRISNPVIQTEGQVDSQTDKHIDSQTDRKTESSSLIWTLCLERAIFWTWKVNLRSTGPKFVSVLAIYILDTHCLSFVTPSCFSLLPLQLNIFFSCRYTNQYKPLQADRCYQIVSFQEEEKNDKHESERCQIVLLLVHLSGLLRCNQGKSGKSHWSCQKQFKVESV